MGANETKQNTYKSDTWHLLWQSRFSILLPHSYHLNAFSVTLIVGEVQPFACVSVHAAGVAFLVQLPAAAYLALYFAEVSVYATAQALGVWWELK
jgi:hypothetical protein